MNKENIKQGPEGGLDESGIEQAKQLGAAFKGLKIEEIVSSPYERAVETARLMKESMRVRLRTSPLLAERKNPSEVIGKPVDDPEVARIMALIENGYHEDSYRYADEENFEDLTARAEACLKYLERRPRCRVAVVTHHTFLQLFLSYMLYRDALDSSGYTKLAFFNPVDNSGITICVYRPIHSPFSPTRGWEILSYNQTAS